VYKIFSIECTGDACVGDRVRFSKTTWSGRYPNARRAGSEVIVGLIVKDSYGADKQQHTFTILRHDTNEKIRIKGRNLYRAGCYREPWRDEYNGYSPTRAAALEEKHARGDAARADRAARRDQEGWY